MNTKEIEELEKEAERLRNEVWERFGFGGEPTMICIYCGIPCKWDQEKDIILCNKCGRDWTLESMEDECKKRLGIKEK